MGYTDAGDSFEDMKVRANYRKFNFPYLYDGETQKVSQAYDRPANSASFYFRRGAQIALSGTH